MVRVGGTNDRVIGLRTLGQMMETKRPEQKGISKHALIMVLCCLIPIMILAVLWAIGVSGSYLIFGVILLCPALHILMMRGMHRESGDGGHEH